MTPAAAALAAYVPAPVPAVKLSVSTSFDGDALNLTATMRTVADVASVIAMLSAVGKLMKDS